MRTYLKLMIIALILISTLQNCGVLRTPFKKTIILTSSIPPGIDTVVYKEAKKKADSLMASEEEEDVARRLKNEGQLELEKNETLSRALQVFRKRAKNDTVPPPPPVQEEITVSDEDVMVIHLKQDTIKTLKKKVVRDTLTIPIIELMAKVYLDNAMQKFQDAKQVNRFDLENVRQMGELLQRNPGSMQQSIEQYEYFARYQKGYHGLFFRLGDNYEAINDWENALRNYKEAIRVFYETADLKMFADSASVQQDSLRDRETLTDYWIRRAIAEMKLSQGDSAMLSWLNARNYVNDRTTADYIEEQMQRVMWDSLNVPAVVLRDSLDKLYNREQYFAAKLGYMDLLKIIKTQKARDEIEFLIAEMDFRLEEKFKKENNIPKDQDLKEDAIRVIDKVLMRADSEKKTKDIFEAPVPFNVLYFYYIKTDSFYKTQRDTVIDPVTNEIVEKDVKKFVKAKQSLARYNELSENDYLYEKMQKGELKADSTYKQIFYRAGQLCYDYGELKMRQGDYDVGQIYLEKSSKIDWPKNYLPLFTVLRFNQIRRNFKAAFQNVYDLLERKEKMSPEELCQTLTELQQLLMKPGIRRMDLAQEIYTMYLSCHNGEAISWKRVYLIVNFFRTKASLS